MAPWSMRWWLLGLPPGIGLATLKSILKLWVGFGPSSSGVFSAGNGPAMRAAPIGAFFWDDPSKIDDYIRISTRMTHTDPKAEVGAKFVAYLAAWIIRDNLTTIPPKEHFLRVWHKTKVTGRMQK